MRITIFLAFGLLASSCGKKVQVAVQNNHDMLTLSVVTAGGESFADNRSKITPGGKSEYHDLPTGEITLEYSTLNVDSVVQGATDVKIQDCKQTLFYSSAGWESKCD